MNNGRFTVLYKFIDELRKEPLLLCGILLVATLLLYAPVSHYDFIGLDDSAYVVENVHVNTGLIPANIVWAFTRSYRGNWDPITWLSHMTDCQLFGLNPGAHHCVNLALHLANVLLLFYLLRLGTGAVWRSFLVAILFAVHPLNVETVAWIAERKSLLSAFFSLLTIAAYGWYLHRPGWKRYLAILASFSLALMSKPMAVTLPLALLLLDYWPLHRFEELPFLQRWVRLFTGKVPLMFMSAASCYATMVAERSAGALISLSALPLSLRLENVVHSYAVYIEKLFWPAKLAVLYPIPDSLPAVELVASAIVLAGITTTVLYLHRLRFLAMGWFWYLIALIPVIGIIQFNKQAMADRFAYIPFIGLFIVMVWGGAAIADKASASRAVQAFASLCLVVALTMTSSRYLHYWQNEMTLLTHARNVTSQPDPLIEGALANGLIAAGRTDEALEHYQLACTLDPRDPICHYDMAKILFERNETGKAIEECHTVSRLTSDRTVALSVSCYVTSGLAMMKQGAFSAAEREFEGALAIDPNNPTALHFRNENLRFIGH